MLAFLLWKVQLLPVLLKQRRALCREPEGAPLTYLAALRLQLVQAAGFSCCRLTHSPIDKSFSALSKHVYCLTFINLGKSMSSLMPGKTFGLQKGLEQALHFSSVQPVKFFLLQRHNFIIHAVFKNSWHRFSQAQKKKKFLSSRGQMWKISSQKIIRWKVLSMKLLWKRVSNISFSGHDQVPAVILTEIQQLSILIQLAAPEVGIYLENFQLSRAMSQNNEREKKQLPRSMWVEVPWKSKCCYPVV